MKNCIPYLFIILSITLNSCNSEENEIETKNNSSWTLSENFLKDGVKLGSITNIDKLNKSMSLLISEINEFEEGYHIVYAIKTIEQDLYMTGYQIYDTNNALVKEEGKTSFLKIGGPYISFDAGDCPEGYTSLGKCNNFSADRDDCLGGLAQNYFSESLSSIGDCAEVRLIVGAFTTRACGRTC